MPRRRGQGNLTITTRSSCGTVLLSGGPGLPRPAMRSRAKFPKSPTSYEPARMLANPNGKENERSRPRDARLKMIVEGQAQAGRGRLGIKPAAHPDSLIYCELDFLAAGGNSCRRRCLSVKT